MGIRTGAAYLASLRDEREIWIDGERVGDVTTDRRFASAARAVAALYDMQHAPDLRARMTYKSPTSSAPVGLSFIQPASIDDLVARREMVKTWNDSTCGMLGRSPDYMNIMLTGFASANLAFGEKDKRFADNVLNYYLHVRENDLTMTTRWSIRRSTAPARSSSRRRTSPPRSCARPPRALSSPARAWSPHLPPSPTTSW